MQKNAKTSLLKLTQAAILTAIIFLLAFTPIGFLRIGVIEITFLVIPVAVGAVILGPAYGAFLGFVFGMVSFIQCFTGSPFGSALLSVSPIYTLILCVVPRTLMGFLSALIFKGMKLVTKNDFISCGISSMAAALLNTLLFMLTLIPLFGSTDYIREMMTSLGASDFLHFAVLFVGLNGLIEAAVSAVIGFAISSVIIRFLPKTNPISD